MNKYLLIIREELIAMPRSDEENLRIREERRTSILEASVTVFAKKGLGATRIADIAEAGEMSQGLIYRYFNNKEEIYQAIIERIQSGTSQLAQQALKQSGTPLEKLRWLLEVYTAYVWQRPHFALLVEQALINEVMPEKTRSIAFKQVDMIVNIVHQLIIEGQEKHEVIEHDPGTLTAMVLACLSGLNAGAAYIPQMLGISGQPDVDLILRMVKA
jgi:AcrR family transcriptional regulator